MKSCLRSAHAHRLITNLLPALWGATLLVACGDKFSGDPVGTQSGTGIGPGASLPDEEEELVLVEDDEELEGASVAPGGVDVTTACQAVSSQAEGRSRPMDVIVMIDNSGSMEEEINSVERNINENFAQILAQSGVDYRVIMVSGYRNAPPQPMDGNNGGGGGRRFNVCVEPPLGPNACDTRGPEDSPHNAERFIHFDQPIGSTDGPCQLLKTMKSRPVASEGRRGGTLPVRADDPLLQAGWTAHLRPDAFKAFVMIGDDTVDCQWEGVDFAQQPLETAVAEFDKALRASAPDQFGASELERRYAWHSIVGVAPNADPQAVYEPSEGLVDAKCESAVEVGVHHQALSRLTGGLRYPVCNVDSYDAVFQRIAKEVVSGASLPCSWQIPSAPDGQTFDKDRVNIAYTPGDGSVAPELGRVDGAAACAGTEAWYYDNPAAPTTVHACPVACERFKQDAVGKVELLFGCATKAPRAPL
ncbi:MAG: hypothetical protein RJA70_1474 [Pseudomonadota bacterium]|jgi:hypothetical protein